MFDELMCIVSIPVSHMSKCTPCVIPYLFLFHEFGVWYIIYDIFAENRRSKNVVYFFSIDVLQFPIKDELVAFLSQIDCNLPTKEDKGEDVSILMFHNEHSMQSHGGSTNLSLAFGKEVERIDPIRYRATNNWQQMKDHWWFIPLFEQELLKNVGNNDRCENRYDDEETVNDTF